ncbi:MAG: sulfotransferase, partial [Acetobacteraceae bacterium]|nr:sulfotransferase [Acetobacteraceae bacterium]
LASLLAPLDRALVRGLGLPARMLDAASLARRGDAAALAADDALAPLGLLLEEYRRHADLTLIGCIAARFDVTRLLRNHAALAAREAREPDLLARPVTQPIVITGMPRSGTTFLHKLLAEDPENRSPAVWETVLPLPRNAADTPAKRMATVSRQLAAFERMAPGFRAVHPIDADSPQECTEITAHVFRSFRFETTHHIPGYRAWLREADHAPAYRFHRRFLQHLQQSDGRARRWVVKCPDHVFALDALREVYPDARVVMLHRDPVEVLASVAGLTAILRGPFTPVVDRAAVGRQVLADWVAGAEAMLHAETTRVFPPEQVLHLRFRDLTAAPMAAIEALYDRFGLPLEQGARTRMQRRITEEPRGGYGGVTHRLEEYGIDPAAARAMFGDYAARFGVA